MASPWVGIAPVVVGYEPLAGFYPHLLHPKAQLQIAEGESSRIRPWSPSIPGTFLSFQSPPCLLHASYP